MVGSSSSPIIQVFNAGNTGATGDVLLPDPSDTAEFLVKYGPSGTQFWSTRIAGGGGSLGSSTTVVGVDNLDNVYLIGVPAATTSFFNAGNMGNTGDLVLPAGASGSNGFIAKYNGSGIIQWATYIIGYLYGLAVDPAGNVYVVGASTAVPSTSASLPGQYFNAGNTGSTPNLTVPGNPLGGGNSSTLVAKYNTNGIIQWATHTDGNNVDYGLGIALDPSGNVYITGSYFDTVLNIFSAGNVGSTPNYTLPKFSSTFDAYVIAYNNNGIFLWATHISGNSESQGFAITTDSNSNVYASGYYVNTTSNYFNAGNTGSTPNLIVPNASSPITYDQYLVKYNNAGIIQWATRVGARLSSNGNNALGAGLATDAANNVYMTGSGTLPAIIFYSAGDVGIIPELTIVNAYAPLFDSYIVKFDTNGTLQYVDQIDGNGNEDGAGVVADAYGNVYTTGSYTANPLVVYPIITLGSTGTTGVVQVSNSSFGGSSDAYLIKYGSPDIFLPAGLFCGQRKIIVTTGAPFCVTVIPASGVIVGNNVTSLMSCQTGNTIELLWTGTQWIIVSNNGFTF
jgi:hypothetical protein